MRQNISEDSFNGTIVSNLSSEYTTTAISVVTPPIAEEFNTNYYIMWYAGMCVYACYDIPYTPNVVLNIWVIEFLQLMNLVWHKQM